MDGQRVQTLYGRKSPDEVDEQLTRVAEKAAKVEGTVQKFPHIVLHAFFGHSDDLKRLCMQVFGKIFEVKNWSFEVQNSIFKAQSLILKAQNSIVEAQNSILKAQSSIFKAQN